METAASILKQWNNGSTDNYSRGKILVKKGIVVGGDDIDMIIIKFIIEEGKKQGIQYAKLWI